MIIQEIKYNSRFFFKKPEIILVTDQGKIKLDFEINKEQIKELNRILAGTKINSLQDVEKTKKDLDSINKELTDNIQLAIINSSKQGWMIVNKTTKQVPRPVYSLLKKDTGIKDFFVMSLNSKNFDATLQAFRDVQSKINKKLNGETLKDDEKIISLIKEAIDEIYQDLDFEIRIGAVFNNYSNGKYIYSGKQLTEEEQINYLQNLIDTYDLLYLETPFYENSTETYKKFTEEHKNICLISINSRINDYTKALNEELCNTIVYKYTNIKDFRVNIQNIKDYGMNIILEGNSKIVNLASGFMIPLIKINEKNSSEIIKQITQTTLSIQEYATKEQNV